MPSNCALTSAWSVQTMIRGGFGDTAPCSVLYRTSNSYTTLRYLAADRSTQWFLLAHRDRQAAATDVPATRISVHSSCHGQERRTWPARRCGPTRRHTPVKATRRRAPSSSQRPLRARPTSNVSAMTAGTKTAGRLDGPRSTQPLSHPPRPALRTGPFAAPARAKQAPAWSLCQGGWAVSTMGSALAAVTQGAPKRRYFCGAEHASDRQCSGRRRSRADRARDSRVFWGGDLCDRASDDSRAFPRPRR